MHPNLAGDSPPRHRASADDRAFGAAFEACEIAPSDFGHRDHLRLAYVYLTELDTESAHRRMRDALHTFIEHNGVDPAKYHETLTRAWMLAVRHFMEKTPTCESAEDFLAHHPRILDSKIMLSHYSEEALFSDQARAEFVEPDRAPIPRHERPHQS